MVAKYPDSLCHIILVGHHRTCFAICSQVFSRVEAETSGIPYGTARLPLYSCAMGLTGVLDYTEPFCFGNVHDGVHICHLAIQVHRNYWPLSGLLWPSSRSGFMVYVVFINIHKYRACTAKANCLYRCDEGIGHGNYFIPGAYTQREQCCPERICAVAYPYACLHWQYSANASSNPLQTARQQMLCSPPHHCSALEISFLIDWYWALRSKNGTGIISPYTNG